MKKLLNTLYVTTEGAYLAKDGESVVVKVERETKLRVPIHALGSIVCIGHISVSPYLMAFCGERDVAISFLTPNGKFQARVEGPATGNVLLRREQYRRSDDHAAAAVIARAMVLGKVANCRTVLQRAMRDHAEKQDGDGISNAVQRLGHYLRRLKQDADLEVVRGIEGEASKTYFSVFNDMITAQCKSFSFAGRNRRPPTDNVNCLMSLIYTLLVHDLRSAAEAVGLDPQVGFLHRDRPGRPSLALDMMEEFRAPFADRLVLSLVNRQQLQQNDFLRTASGGVQLKDDSRKIVYAAYQERKQDEITHPFVGERVKVGILFLLQAKLLARHLRGDLDGYPPCFWK